jgi:hypothetical protein
MSAEAVERLAEKLVADADAPDGARYQPYTDSRMRDAAVTLRALLAERDRLRAALLEARREGFLAALVMAERRCMDAATYVRTRARTNEDHSIANTYEQAGTMVRAVPVPDNMREVTGLEYRGG